MRATLTLLLLASLLIPSAAVGAVFCVDAGDPLSDDILANRVCGFETTPADCEPERYGSLAEAMDGVQAWQALNPPTVNTICAIHSGVITESVTIDNSDGRYGDELLFSFVGDRGPGESLSPWCPSAGAIGFDVQAGFIGIQGLVSRRSVTECDDGERPTLVSASGTGYVVLVGAFLDAQGSAEPVLTMSDGGGIFLHSSRISGGGASAATGDGRLDIRESDLSLMAPPAGQPLIGLVGGLNMVRSGLAYSYVRDAPMVSVSGELLVTDSKIISNVVGGGAALFDVTPSGVAPNVHFFLAEVASNRLIAETPDAAPIGDSRSPVDCFVERQCMPCGAGERSGYDGPEFELTVPGTPSGAALVAVNTTPGAPASVALVKSWVVANSGGVLELLGNGGDVVVTLLHDTIEAGGDPVLRSEGVNQRLISARNLFVGEASADVTGDFVVKETALDALEVESPSWAALFGGLPGPVGAPWGGDSADAFADPDEYRSRSLCSRAADICPDVDEQDCDQAGFQTTVTCPVDAATQFVASAAFTAEQAVEWPWLGAFFDSELAAGDPANTPGADGWLCGDLLLPKDDDGDGASDLFDCNPGEQDEPFDAPAEDGYSEEGCEDEGATCYECPDGSLEHGDDDDDATGTWEMDNAADCYAKGCGTPFGGGTALFLPLLLLGLRREREP